ncbi:MAG: PilN domain-containing protein [Clostridiales bacterium]|nr:PilN domain-containing protein [Clostridiales bacterium]
MSQKLKPHTLDLLKSYHAKQSAPSPVGGRTVALVAVPTALAVLFAAGYGALYASSYRLQGEIAAIRQMVDADTARQQEEQSANQELRAYLSRINQAKALDKLIVTYPLLNRELFDGVRTAAGDAVSLSTYSYDGTGGILTVTAAASTAQDIPAFLRRLQNSGFFTAVSSNGYEKSNDQYTFTALCTVKPEKERAS